MSVPKLKRENLYIGIFVAVGLYFGFKFLLPKIFPPKIDTNANFSNADGQSGEFVAQQYDASKNATWISYKGSNVVGYWQDGKIKEGTVINQLT
jgi:hypothetical protein